MLNSHKSPVTAASFNQTGDKFASASKNGTIIIWELNKLILEAVELLTIPNAHADWITDLKWSNTSEFILTSSNDFTLKIWNSADGKQRQHLIGHTSNVKACSFQYGCAVSCDVDGSVKVWSHKGHEITTLIGHQKAVNACDVWVKLKSKNKLNKETMKTDEAMDTGNLWGDQVSEENWLARHKSASLNRQDFEVDKFYLVTVSDDSTIRLWKPIEADYLISLEEHSAKVNSVDLGRNSVLVTGSSDKSLNVWNMSDYFKNVTAGLHIHGERLIKNHNAEIACICPTSSGAYILTSSRDGVLMVWRCVFSQLKLKEISFVLEVQAHDRSCNRVCILNESDNHSFTFVTCTDKSVNPIKIWRFEENATKKASVDLIQQLKTPFNSYILFVDQVKKFLVTVESDLFRLSVKFYKFINKSWIPQSASGCSIINSGKSIMVSQVKMTGDSLFITLPIDEIVKININDIIKHFQAYNLGDSKTRNSIVLTSKVSGMLVDLSLEGSKRNWFSSVNEFKSKTLAGDVNGNIYENENFNCDLKKIKSIHKSRITELICFNNERIISASDDGTLKIWNSHNFETQLGQYNLNTGVTVLAKIPSINKAKFGQYDFIFGDKMGNLNLLRWYDDE